MERTVLEALRAMRPPFVLYEADIHAMVGECLAQNGLPFTHEARLGGGCRIDYLVGDVGVEIKKGKPNATLLCRQLNRYAMCDQVAALVVVTWQSVALPVSLCGKPVRALVLGQLWGVSLP